MGEFSGIGHGQIVNPQFPRLVACFFPTNFGTCGLAHSWIDQHVGEIRLTGFVFKATVWHAVLVLLGVHEFAIRRYLVDTGGSVNGVNYEEPIGALDHGGNAAGADGNAAGTEVIDHPVATQFRAVREQIRIPNPVAEHTSIG